MNYCISMWTSGQTLAELMIEKKEKIAGKENLSEVNRRILEARKALWMVLSDPVLLKEYGTRYFLPRLETPYTELISCEALLQKFPNIEGKLAYIEEQLNAQWCVFCSTEFHKPYIDTINLYDISMRESGYDSFSCSFLHKWIVSPLKDFIENIVDICRHASGRHSWHWWVEWRKEPTHQQKMEMLLWLIDERFKM